MSCYVFKISEPGKEMEFTADESRLDMPIYVAQAVMFRLVISILIVESARHIDLSQALRRALIALKSSAYRSALPEISGG
jgi:hypothetical protein